jgi:succinate-semialdehyde dehydrogenase/glutarate-semialdehyde dehydrogenase
MTNLNLISPALAYIDGQWVGHPEGKTFGVNNPANGKSLAQVPDMGTIEAQEAIEAAAQAFELWRKQTAIVRADLLWRWYELIRAHAEVLAELITAEQGKPLAEARGEVAYGNSFVRWFAEEARRSYGTLIPTESPDRRLMVIKQPVGVVAAITPWNFPLAMITRKLAPALAAGCTVVLKPSEETPLTALALAKLAEMAGIPPGVLNVVTGLDAPTLGLLFCTHPTVRKLSFTGSTAVGKRLMQQSADGLKRLSLELGGNAPFIVFDDADLNAAVEGAIVAKYRNGGQTCVCANRILVQDAVYESFVEKFSQAVSFLQVGQGDEPQVDIGPLINPRALEKVKGLLADAQAKGAHIVLGGKPHALGGTFFEPTVLTEAKPAMLLSQEEIFGPVAPIYRFRTEEEAISLANSTPYGLAAYFYGRDIGRVWRVAEALEYGMVGVNTGLVSTAVAPFGGIKHSGLGREGAREGLEEYLQIKYMALGGL